MMTEGTSVYLYKQEMGGNESYVLGICDGPSTSEIPRGELEELAGEFVSRVLPPGMRGHFLVNWNPPTHLIGKPPRKGIIREDKRSAFNNALPDGVSVNLRNESVGQAPRWEGPDIGEESIPY